ncbi:MAG: hypothetical protein M1570_10380 [Chloroflexi bacterium]|nr:hypothetical protein [Chloroflexota bacterium]
MRWIQLLTGFALLALLALNFGAGIAQAEGPYGETQLLPNLGPVQPGLTPGVGGYKVFGPDALKRVAVRRPSLPGASPASPLTEYRAGWTDEYQCGDAPVYACGSHNSQSDLNEEEINIDGAARRTDITGWQDFQQKHTVGKIAVATTKIYYGPLGRLYTAIGHSWHHFHKTGYVDDDFQTEDTWSG